MAAQGRLLLTVLHRFPSRCCIRCCSGGNGGNGLSKLLRSQPTARAAGAAATSQHQPPVLLFEARLYRLYWLPGFFACGGLFCLCALGCLARECLASASAPVEAAPREGEGAGEAGDTLVGRFSPAWLTSPITFLILASTAVFACSYAVGHSLRLAHRLMLEPGGRHLLVTTLTGTHRLQVDRVRYARRVDRSRWWDMPYCSGSYHWLATDAVPPILAVSKDARCVRERAAFTALLKRFFIQS